MKIKLDENLPAILVQTLLTATIFLTTFVFPLFQAGYQLVNLDPKDRKSFLDNLPGNIVIDFVIAVNQNISEADDAAIFRDAIGQQRVDFTKPVHRFADNFKLPFHRPPEHQVTFKIIARLPCREQVDTRHGVLYVDKKRFNFRQHTASLDV